MIEKFIKNFKNQLLDTEVEVSVNTVFRDLEDWDSLTAMAVITMLEDEYKVKITTEEFKQQQTIQDLYQFVHSKK